MGAPVNKNPDFIFHQRTPPNGGPPLNRLIDEFATPVQDFFLRTHGEMPEFDSSTYRLTAGWARRSPQPNFLPGVCVSMFPQAKNDPLHDNDPSRALAPARSA